jgi:hypothetical protein
MGSGDSARSWFARAAADSRAGVEFRQIRDLLACAREHEIAVVSRALQINSEGLRDRSRRLRSESARVFDAVHSRPAMPPR